MILNPDDVGLFQFSTDEELFGSLDPLHPSWFSWNTLFKVYDHVKLSRDEQRFFGKATGGLFYHPQEELPNNWLIIVGRGGGKTRSISRITLYRTFTFNKPLHPGQIAENIIVAPRLDDGMIGFDYMVGMLEENEELYQELLADPGANKPIIKNSQMARMRFSNNTKIKLSPVTRTAGRGKSVWTLIMEEAAHFKYLSASRFSDEEVFNSANPGRGRFGINSMCFAITTPFTKEGFVWRIFNEFYGKKNDFWLVIQGSVYDFNPLYKTEPEMCAFLEQERGRDPEKFKREYLAQFTDAETGAIPGQIVADCVVRGRKEMRYCKDKQYFGFIDAAGLSPGDQAKFSDEYSVGIAHIEVVDGKFTIIEDQIRAWSAFMPERLKQKVAPADAIKESIELFKSYQVRHLMGDKKLSYVWQPEYEKAGFKFETCPLSKSDLYLELIPVLNNHEIQLLDDDIQNDQLKSLDRRRSSGGRDVVVHREDTHDDRANVVAGLAFIGKQKMAVSPVSVSDVRIGGEGRVVADVFDERGFEPAASQFEDIF